MHNKLKANTALMISAAGALATLPSISPLVPSMSGFTLGLLNHGFLAATIGGLADWFAVTALFHKPLGISWRTEILKKNRKRIMDAIVEFVSSDLLSAKNIINNLKSENTANLLITYFQNNDGRARVKTLINDTLVEIASSADTKSIAKSITPIIKSEAHNIDAKQIIDAVVNVLTKDEHSRKILAMVFGAVHDIFKSEFVQEALRLKISTLRREYEADSAGRALVLNAINLTDDKILTIINENVDKRIKGTINTLTSDGIVDPDSLSTAANMSMYFANFLKSSTSDENTQKFFGDFKKVLANNFDLADYIKNWLDKYLKSENYLKNQQKLQEVDENSSHIIKLEKVNPIWQGAVEQIIDDKIDDFIASPVLQDKFDRFIKKLLESLINNYHDAIPGLIRERLDSLSDEELTTFVEGKVADDLQMIRINGSICGCAVGILLYLVSYAVQTIAGS
ncbi:MAG: DUF445 domain-containing protein [Selenomonadaceae bacterium]|nr:DUF445 domain-containing protein [Selenomonadaceae bacterium]